MATEIDIVNAALASLGETTLANLSGTDDRTKQVNALWPRAREAVLRAHPWNCAIKRGSLTTPATLTDSDFAFSYSLPADCIRVLQITLAQYAPEFRVEQRKLLTDEGEPVHIKYVFASTTYTDWDPLLVDAAAKWLAWMLAWPVTKNASLVQVMQQQALAAIREARTVDGQEDTPEQVGDAPFLAVRTIP